MKAQTPNFTAEIEFLFGAIGKSALDELDGLLDGFVRSQQEMEVIGHQNEFVQAIFPLVAIAKKDIEEEVGHSVRLEHMSALGTRRRHEVSFHNRYLGGRVADPFVLLISIPQPESRVPRPWLFQGREATLSTRFLPVPLCTHSHSRLRKSARRRGTRGFVLRQMDQNHEGRASPCLWV